MRVTAMRRKELKWTFSSTNGEQVKSMYQELTEHG